MTKRGFKRPFVAALHDLFMAALSFVLALYLRLGDAMMGSVSGYLVEGTVLFTVVCGLVFWRLRFYRALWRYASVSDLIALTKGVTLAILVFVPVLFLATRLQDYPRSAAAINWWPAIVGCTWSTSHSSPTMPSSVCCSISCSIST